MTVRNNKGKHTNKRVELLAPSGNYEAFLAALNNGADAMYLAASKFGARAYAGNFSDEELIRALDTAHLYDRKIYLTVNTVLKNAEIAELSDMIRPFYEHGLDGVIVQDVGVLSVLKTAFPDLPLHASTQMSVTDAYGANELKQFGVSRIVPARELSLLEIETLKEQTGLEMETFIHGAMCYCYSGKCLFSSFLGGRSGNRGRCAQPCRLEYDNAYPLSMKDMYTLRIIPKLIESGIDSFKIEGRMKSPDYVSCVTGIYRKYIDMYYENPSEYKVDRKDEELLLNEYTRSGNCEGYYHTYNGRSMITLDFPGYNGKKADNPLKDNYISACVPKLKLRGEAGFFKGAMSYLNIYFGDIFVTVQGDVVDNAINRATDANTIERQLLKTGDSEFVFDKITVDCDEDIFVPIGAINALRRSGIDAIRNEILKEHSRTDLIDAVEHSSVKCETINSSEHIAKRNHRIAAECISLETFNALVSSNDVDELIVPATLFNIADVPTDKTITLKLPLVLRRVTDEYIRNIRKIIDTFKITRVIVCNYEGLGVLKAIDFSGEIIGDEHIYALSGESIAALYKMGFDNLTVPVELNKAELYNRGQNGEYMLTYGRLPLMVSANCVRRTTKSCTGNPGFSYINDRKNIDFPVYHDCNSCKKEECSNILYNSVPMYIEPDSALVKRLQPDALRLVFTTETSEEIKAILQHFKHLNVMPEHKYTRGHINHGVE